MGDWGCRSGWIANKKQEGFGDKMIYGGELAGGMMHGGKGECMGLSDIRLKLQMADYLLAS